MPRLPFVRHLLASKLRYRYASCRHPGEKPRQHALRLLARTDHPAPRPTSPTCSGCRR